MKIMSIMWLAIMALALCVVFPANAQSSSQTTPAQNNAAPTTVAPTTRTITGCVLRGDAADRYKFSTKNGTVWEIVANTLKMDHYVGHTVTVTGKLTPNPYTAKTEEKAEEKGKEPGAIKRDLIKNNAGTLDISKVGHVGALCTQ